jgi:hypothetical protein
VAVLPHRALGGSQLPLNELGGWLLLILACGLVTGLLAVRATLRAPLLGALRGD